MTIMRMLLALLCSFSLSAQPLDDFERVLIPAYVTPAIHGANGSRFDSWLLMFAPAGTRYFPSYLQASRIPEVGTFPYSVTMRMFDVSPPSRVGRMLYIERARSAEVALDPRFLSRAAGDTKDHRVRLPVVRENDFRSTAFSVGMITDMGSGRA